MRNYYFLIVYFLRILFRILFGFSVIGINNWKKDQGFIVASNHQSYLDPFFVGSAAPVEMCYMAKKEIFSWPVLGFIAKNLNAFPTTRKGFDIGAIKHAKRMLKNYKPLLVFFEGTRSRDGKFLPVKRGVGLLSYINQVDILPTYVHGSLNLKNAIFRSPAVTVKFGQMISISKYQDLDLPVKEIYTMISNDVMNSVKELKNSIIN